jgi:hypothetical protein
VALDAILGLAPFFPRQFPTVKVFFVRDWLQMVWIAAVPNATGMVKNHPNRNLSLKFLIQDNVDARTSALLPVGSNGCAAIAVFIEQSIPNPAGRRFDYLRPERMLASAFARAASCRIGARLKGRMAKCTQDCYGSFWHRYLRSFLKKLGEVAQEARCSARVIRPHLSHI